MTRALLIALVLASSCKKEAPKGDLPPATDWGSGASSAAKSTTPPTTPPATPPPNPHAGMAGDNPHAGQPAPKTLAKLPDGRLALGPFSIAAPADWTAKPVTSNMRAADFLLADKPATEFELIVYYFGDKGAGSVEDNIDRWLKQVEQPDGKASRDVAKIEKIKFGGQDATFVSLTGHYRAAAMSPMAQDVDIADAEVLGAIVASPSGPYYFKLVGTKATIDAQAKPFRAMLDSLTLR